MVGHFDVNLVRRRTVGPRPTFVNHLDEFFRDVHAPPIAPTVVKPAGEFLGRIVVENIHIEFALLGEAGEREIAGTDKPGNGVVRVGAEAKVKLGMEGVPKVEFHDHLTRLELGREASQSGFIVIGRGTHRELGTKLLGQPTFQADDSLIAHLFLVRQQAVGLPQILLRQTLHADQQSALLSQPPTPPFNQRIDRLPAAQVEITDTEVGSFGDFYRLPQSGQEFEFDVVENAWHYGCLLK